MGLRRFLRYPLRVRSGYLRHVRSSYTARLARPPSGQSEGAFATRVAERDPVASEKLANTFDVFEYLLPGVIAFSRFRCQPLVAGQKQLFKGVTDSSVGIKVLSGKYANSSVISVCSRLVIAANGLAQTHEQSLQNKTVSGGHTETRA